MTRYAAPATALACAALLFTGCSSDSSELVSLREGTVRVASAGSVDVDVESKEPIRLGKNTVFVSFPSRAGAELASASALMPAHGHGSPAPTIERDGERFRVRDLVLYMSGRWEVRLALKVDGRDDEAIVGVDVP